MAACKLCGKKGLFLKLNKDGYCDACAQRLAAAAEEAEKRRKKAEEERQRKTKAAQEELHAIPLAGIKLAEDGPKRKSGFEEPKYSNITPKGSFESIVVIDTETTGLAPSKDRIIELAAVKFDNGRPVAAFHTFVNPEKPLSAEAQSINKITENQLKDAPTISAVLPAFDEFVGSKSIVVGHNLEFDLKFLYYSGSSILDGKNKLIDTCAQAKRTLKAPKMKYDKEYDIWEKDWEGDYDVDDYKLETLCEYYNIINPEQHSALSDAYATGKLFNRLVLEKQ